SAKSRPMWLSGSLRGEPPDHIDRRVELRPPPLPALCGLGILAPIGNLVILIHMRRAPCGFRIDQALAQCNRQQPRTGHASYRNEGRHRHEVDSVERNPELCQRLHWLLLMQNADSWAEADGE